MRRAAKAEVGRGEASSARPARLDIAIALVALLLSALTAGALVAPGLAVRLVAPALDLVLDSLTAFVTIAVAVLAWLRFRRGGETAALFQAAAFLVLAISSCLSVALVVTGLDVRAGMSLSAPGAAPLYDVTAARLYAGALLVIGGIVSLRGRAMRWPRLVAAASGVAMLLTLLTVHLAGGALPSLGTVLPVPGSLAVGSTGALPAPTPLGAAVQVIGAALFLWASGLSRRLYRRHGAIGDAYLAVGLVFAAFAQVQTALYPGAYTGLVTSGNVLRLAFDLILLLGIQAEAGAMLASLRRARDDLERLREAEVERAALEERARISRELHDGLAQNLWLAKLKTGRLSSLPDLGMEAQALADELGTAIDAGLAEAQQAVAALRLSGGPQGTLAELLQRTADEFADRFGLRVECTCAPELPVLPPRAQAEVLRIVQEALNNVRRHADATVVRVHAGVEQEAVVVSVRDNGRGFDPAGVGSRSYGLSSMRERAALIGGELRIDSRPRDGTRVQLIVPVDARRTGVAPVAPAAPEQADARRTGVAPAAPAAPGQADGAASPGGTPVDRRAGLTSGASPQIIVEAPSGRAGR